MIFQISWGVRLNILSQRLMPLYKLSLYKLSLYKLLVQAIACIIASTCLATPSLNAQTQADLAPEDIPEEVLRGEIYTDARSPIDGTLLTATEYVELMENLRSLDRIPPEDLVSPQIQEVINLLKLRKFLRQIVPFIP